MAKGGMKLGTFYAIAGRDSFILNNFSKGKKIIFPGKKMSRKKKERKNVRYIRPLTNL